MTAYETVLVRNVLGFVDWHWHEELQFCLVTRGSVRFLRADIQADVQKRQGVFIGSGVPHTARSLTENLEYTVSRIACEYGFSTVSAYIEQFLSRTGFPPGKYREKDAGG